jgi:hypothetical protein
LGFLLGFLLQWAVFVAVRWASGASSPEDSGSADAWAGRLRAAAVLGLALGGACLALLVLDCHRGLLARAAHPAAAAAQLTLAAVAASAGGVLPWGLALLLVTSGLWSLLQVRRTRDQVNFLLVLLDVAVQVLSHYPLLVAVVLAGCLAHLAFLLWWSAALATALASSGVPVVLLVLFNGYWTSQALRLLVALVTVGIVSHWFAHAYPSDEDEDEPSGEGVPMSNPLLFDGAFLPPAADGSRDGAAARADEGARGGDTSPRGAGVSPGAAPDAAAVVVHLARSGSTTSLGTVCRAALACSAVRAAEASLRVCDAWPCLERALCADWCDRWVRSHHELLLCHVASGAKSHATAARDVWRLVDESGLQVVQEDDVAGPVLRAACLAAAAATALAVAAAAPHRSDPAQWALLAAAAMATAFATAAQALQAVDSAVAAVYVCFAEHPASLRAHFPLVHHRFARIAEFSTYDVDARR